VQVALLEQGMEDRRKEAGVPELPEGVVGKSPALLRAYADARWVARRDGPVLIHGETGTGKEALAQFIHDLSRPGKPYLQVACGSLGGDLNMQLGELFGHKRGAFAGADRDLPGTVREVQDGSLLLDDLHHLLPPTQVALLPVLP